MSWPSPFTDAQLRDWLVAASRARIDLDHPVANLGSAPFESHDFALFLQSCGVDVQEWYSGAEIVVVGRVGWTVDQLRLVVTLRTGQSLKVYSQEMMVSYIVSGTDPFRADLEVLRRFGSGHAALEYLQQHGFAWPTTLVAGGGETALEGQWPKVGLLAHMGYHVGRNTALDQDARRAILRKVFLTRTLPMVHSAAYLSEWGAPESADRLYKLAHALASFAKNAKRQGAFRTAVRHWEADLSWLKQEFYDGRFQFDWPDTVVR